MRSAWVRCRVFGYMRSFTADREELILLEIVEQIEAFVRRIVERALAPLVFRGHAEGDLLFDQRYVHRARAGGQFVFAAHTPRRGLEAKDRVLDLDADRAGQRGLRPRYTLTSSISHRPERPAPGPLNRLLDAVHGGTGERGAAGGEPFGSDAAQDEAGVRPVRVADAAQQVEPTPKAATLCAFTWWYRSTDGPASSVPSSCSSRA